MAVSQVSIARCPGYGPEELRTALGRALSLLGGLERWVRPGGTVFVKPNLLSPLSAAEDSVYTHPAFAREVIRLLHEIGCRVVVGDDVTGEGGRAFRTCGYDEICRETGARLINVREAGFMEVSCRGGILTRVRISRAALEADAVVNLPKLKTHAFAAFTGAVKNSFGLIPQGSRMRLHRAYPRPDDFGRALLDIHAAVPHVIHIMDAVVAMEGLGPAAGRPRPLGLVLASPDAVALDVVASSISGFEPGAVPTTRAARERAFGGSRLEAIEVLGERLEDVIVSDFDRPAAVAGLLGGRLPSAVYAFIQSRTGFVPKVARSLCTGCGTCAAACPAEAIGVRDGKARLDDGRCIRCLCCNEMCPAHAVRLSPMFLRRVVDLAEAALSRKKRRPGRLESRG
jgi:uncharacterized protein (DUF362 family)/ferredoxin